MRRGMPENGGLKLKRKSRGVIRLGTLHFGQFHFLVFDRHEQARNLVRTQ
jgi:hypothetical protein